MSWRNLKELLLQERRNLEPATVVEFPAESAFETQHSAVLGLYLNTKSEVESAVRVFAKSFEWPELSPIVKFFVGARLEFGWEVASILDTGREGEVVIACPSPESRSTTELLEWLLIDIWPHGCGRFFQTQRWMAEPLPEGGSIESISQPQGPPRELGGLKLPSAGPVPLEGRSVVG